jgi:hypothetical protein|tara:strand:- start:125 stop:418 length:294 start_codon:yes stop_codon:yes gene_type:complete
MTEAIEQWAVLRCEADREAIMAVFPSEEKALYTLTMLSDLFPSDSNGGVFFSACSLEQYKNPTPDIDPDYADAMLHDASLHKDEDSMHWQTEVNPND